MSKYITDFQQTGNSTINVDLVCKDWNERFSICTWINDNEEEYTFIINGKRKGLRLCKTQISKEQAMQIIDRINLAHVKAGIPRSAGSYHTKEFIKSEIERFKAIKQDKEKDLSIINDVIYQYERCL